VNADCVSFLRRYSIYVFIDFGRERWESPDDPILNEDGVNGV